MQGDKIKIRVQDIDYFVTGGDFSSLLAVVKSLPKRRYVGEHKLWLVDASVEMVRGQIENSGFLLEGGTPAPKDAAPVAPVSSHDQIKIETAKFRAAVTGAPFSELLAAIKALPDRRFDGNTKRWLITGSLMELKSYFEKKDMRLDNIEAMPPPPAQPDAPQLSAISTPPTPDLPPVPPPPDAMPDFWDEPMDEPGELPLPVAPPPPPVATATTTASKLTADRRDQIRVMVGKQQLVIAGGTFQEMLAAVKDVPGRRFDGASKQWLLPDDIESVQQHFTAKGFRLEETF